MSAANPNALLAVRISFALAAGAAALLAPSCACAEQLPLDPSWYACLNAGNNFSADDRLKGCSATVESGKETPQNLAIAYNIRGAAYIRKGDYDRAIADLSEAIRLNPSYAKAYTNRGFAYDVGKGDQSRAFADYDEAIRLDPKFAIAYENRGSAYTRRGDYDRGIADLSEAIRLDPSDAMAYKNRGDAYDRRGDQNRAFADYGQAIRLDPQFAGAYNNRGGAYIRKGDYDRAIADLSEAIRLDPKYAHAYGNRADAYDRKGDYDRATADLNEAIRLDPQFAFAYNNRGFAYDGKGDYDRAIADYSEAIRLVPKFALAYTNRGNTYIHMGDYDRAIADGTEAIRFEPKLANAYRQRGNAYRAKGDPDRAIADFDEAIRLIPRFSEAYTNRGDAYKAKGDYDRAITDYRAALEINPSQKDARAALDGLTAKATGITLATMSPSVTPPIASLPAPPGKRIALIIGNSDYRNFPQIPNPRNDAEDLAGALTNLGFEVLKGINLGRDDMEQKFIDFAQKARNADTALAFYAGHGIQHKGLNYLVPVDAQIKDETDLRRFINLQQVVDDMQGARGVRILIIDACRDNDVLKQLASNLPATRSAAFTRGLAAINAADGVLIAFATQPNKVAADGDGRNSPFTAALLHNLQTPGVELRSLFTRVRAEVFESTGHTQRPEVSDSLIGEFVFKTAQPQPQ